MAEQANADSWPHCSRRYSRERLFQAEYERWTYWKLREKEALGKEPRFGIEDGSLRRRRWRRAEAHCCGAVLRQLGEGGRG